MCGHSILGIQVLGLCFVLDIVFVLLSASIFGEEEEEEEVASDADLPLCLPLPLLPLLLLL